MVRPSRPLNMGFLSQCKAAELSRVVVRRLFRRRRVPCGDGDFRLPEQPLIIRAIRAAGRLRPSRGRIDIGLARRS